MNQGEYSVINDIEIVKEKDFHTKIRKPFLNKEFILKIILNLFNSV